MVIDVNSSVISVGTVVCPGLVVPGGSEWSDTLVVPVVGRIVIPKVEVKI